MLNLIVIFGVMHQLATGTPVTPQTTPMYANQMCVRRMRASAHFIIIIILLILKDRHTVREANYTFNSPTSAIAQ